MASPPDGRTLRALLSVVASPHDLPPLDVGAERERMVQALKEVQELGRVELEWLEPASPGGLRGALRDGTYHVVHYVGHSDFTEHGDGVLYLEGDDGNSVRADETLFANLLSDQATLRLVVLNSCEGGARRSPIRTPAWRPHSCASACRRSSGMQFEISDGAAILFAEELHEPDRPADPIDAAMAGARRSMPR